MVRLRTEVQTCVSIHSITLQARVNKVLYRSFLRVHVLTTWYACAQRYKHV